MLRAGVGGERCAGVVGVMTLRPWGRRSGKARRYGAMGRIWEEGSEMLEGWDGLIWRRFSTVCSTASVIWVCTTMTATTELCIDTPVRI